MSPSLAVRELPLFPLPGVVLFPGRPLPLHIFEPRYRMMINTIMETDRCFGVLLFDQETDKPARVGSCAEVLQAQRLPDDRLNVLTLGLRRFRVIENVRETPYRIGLVEWLEDEPLDDLHTTLVNDITTLLRDVVHLSNKLTDRELELPDDLPTDPLELSYWIAGHFQGAIAEQQTLLELQDTLERLHQEGHILETTRKHLAARTVLKDTFAD